MIRIIKVGSSVSGERDDLVLDHVKAIASKIHSLPAKPSDKTVVVVSAFKGVTDRLIREADILWPLSPCAAQRLARAAYVARGETEAAAMFALALGTRAFEGWQVPLYTTGDISEADIELESSGENLIRWFRTGQNMAAVAGFQGLHRPENAVSTLRLGGSDQTAMGLSDIFRRAGEQVTCWIVRHGGVRTADPRLVENARIHPRLCHEELYAITAMGNKRQLMQPEAMALAKERRIPFSIGPLEMDRVSLTTHIDCGRPKRDEMLAVACGKVDAETKTVDISLVGWGLGGAAKTSMREMLREASIPVSGVWRTQIPGVDPGLSAISAAVPSHPEIMRDAVCAVHEGFGLA